MTRRLQNFLASAAALIEQARLFVRESYGESSKIFTEYEEENERLRRKPIVAFTTKLRDLILHARTPFIDSVTGGSEARGRERFTLRLDLKEIRLRFCYSRHNEGLARDYIAAHEGSSLDLELYLLEYYELIRQFCNWFDKRNQEWSKAEWEKSLALHDAAMQSRDHMYDVDT